MASDNSASGEAPRRKRDKATWICGGLGLLGGVLAWLGIEPYENCGDDDPYRAAIVGLALIPIATLLWPVTLWLGWRRDQFLPVVMATVGVGFALAAFMAFGSGLCAFFEIPANMPETGASAPLAE